MNPYSIAYLFFRLAPFIVVCSFVLQSFLALDLRGPVYAAGLVLSCLTTMMVSKMVPSSTTSPNTKCGLISIGESDQMASSMPLSMTVYGFTFWYLCVSVINQIMKAKSINKTKNRQTRRSCCRRLGWWICRICCSVCRNSNRRLYGSIYWEKAWSYRNYYTKHFIARSSSYRHDYIIYNFI